MLLIVEETGAAGIAGALYLGAGITVLAAGAAFRSGFSTETGLPITPGTMVLTMVTLRRMAILGEVRGLHQRIPLVAEIIHDISIQADEGVDYDATVSDQLGMTHRGNRIPHSVA